MRCYLSVAFCLVVSVFTASLPNKINNVGSLAAIPPQFKVLPEVHPTPIQPTHVYMNGIAALVTLAKGDYRGYQNNGIFRDASFPAVQIAVFAHPQSLMKLPRAFAVWGVYKAILDISVRKVWKDTTFYLEYNDKIVGELDIGPAGRRPGLAELSANASVTDTSGDAASSRQDTQKSTDKIILPSSIQQSSITQPLGVTRAVPSQSAALNSTVWRIPTSTNASSIAASNAVDITYQFVFYGATISPPTRVFFTIMEGIANQPLAQFQVQNRVVTNAAFESITQNCWMQFTPVTNPPPARGPQWIWEYAFEALRAMPTLMLENRKFQEMKLVVRVNGVPVGNVHINVGRMPAPRTGLAVADS